jgi:5'-nucleotidase
MQSTTKRPLILVTNDDGVNAGGIKALTEMVLPYGDVVVVAPNTSFSGMSHAITVKVPLYVTLIKQDEQVTVYKSNGTPVDCVKLALNNLLPRYPDLCVSGINHGTNSSVSVHYSGTLGAAREAAIYGIPSIGFSLLSYDPDADFSYGKPFCQKVIEQVLENGLPFGTYLNVNIPDTKNIKGMKVVRQANGHWKEEFLKREDPRGREYFWLTGHFECDEPDATDTDDAALHSGYVSVVPCKLDITDYTLMSQLQHLNHELQVQ